MCNFASFVIEKEKPYRIFAYDLFSHAGIEKVFNLAPDGYVEAEWTSNSPEALRIRTFETDQDETWYKAIILGDYPTRADLLKAFMPDGALSDQISSQVYFDDRGRLHRENGPALIYPNGTQEWFKEGKLHRLDGPALIFSDGTQEWFKDGKCHRENGPAIIKSNGTQKWFKVWFKEGKLHRENGPAIIYSDGAQEWYKEGKLHHLNGPALIYPNGYKKWYKEGIMMGNYI